MLEREKIIEYLSESGDEFAITLLENADSTNRILREMAENGAPEKSVVIAESQSAGRGRLGRSFFSPEGGLYMSVLHRPDGRAEDVCRLTGAVAVAVSRAIEKVSGRKAGIKWVNDIQIEGKKVCGILCEGKLNKSCSALEYVVVGIGVNAFPPDEGFPAELESVAGCVFSSRGEHQRERLAAELLRELLSTERAGLDAALGEYRERSTVLGRRVRLLGTDIEALAEEIDEAYRLIVRLDDGTTRALSSGEISVRAL